MKFYITLLILSLSLTSFAQKIEKDGKTYEVKEERIFLNNEDVTDTITNEQKLLLFKEAEMLVLKQSTEKEKQEREKAEKKKEKAAKKLEKEKKKAEKAAKKAEKELKRAKKLKANYKKSQDKLAQTQKKYKKLKRKGKLSPIDETKWLDKIEKLTKKVEKL